VVEFGYYCNFFLPNLDIIVIVFSPSLRTLVKQPAKNIVFYALKTFLHEIDFRYVIVPEFQKFTYLLFSRL
jgi:hypothetical protein